MNYNIISSSSKGNCIVLENKIMLDIGVSYLKVKPYLKDIKLIFIGHCHKDHLMPSTVKKIAYEKPNIKFLVGDYLVEKLINCGVNKSNIIVIDIGKWYNIGLCKVKIEEVIHDVPNCCLHLEYNKQKVLYVVDTNSISYIEAKGYDLYLVEGNYEYDEVLREKIEEQEKRGEFSYLNRVLKTHLSQKQALDFLFENMNEESKYVFIHKHEGDYNNVEKK